MIIHPMHHLIYKGLIFLQDVLRNFYTVCKFIPILPASLAVRNSVQQCFLCINGLMFAQVDTRYCW